MRIYFGNTPERQTNQSVESWQQTPSPGAKRVQNYGVFAACAGMLLVGLLLRGDFRPDRIWSALLILIFVVPLHEVIHALTTPSWGLSDRTVIGFQRGKGLFLPYMYYDGSQPLWRMLLTGLAPLLLLTVLPIIIILIVPLNASLRSNVGFLAFFNVALAGGDLVNFYWIITHLPLQATVQLDGWNLLWKI